MPAKTQTPPAPGASSARAKAPGGRKRAPGRPNLDSPDQRLRLLDAAISCYARQGIGATSLRDVAVEAGVSPALVHYYYGDKEQLTGEVARQRLLPIFARVHRRVAAVPENDIEQTVAAFVDSMAELIVRHPWWPQLWVREVLCEGGALRDMLISGVAEPGPAHTLAERFAAAQAAGRLNADLDPRLLVASLVALTLFPAVSAPILRSLFDASGLGLEDIGRHARILLHRGLELKP
jgi:AcrR family transcriptional regulator